MERGRDGLHVQVIELHLGRDQRCGLSGGLLPRSGEMVRVAGLVQEVGPALIGLRCTHLNVPAVLALCDRLHRIAPERVIVLWGREAVARREELLASEQVDRILTEPTGEAIVALLQRPQRPITQTDGPRPLDRHDPPLHQLISNSRRLGAAVVVEPLEGSAGLSVDQAVSQILPLLKAGLTVRLQDPDLCGSRSSLRRLLEQLTAAAGRLILPVPGHLVDEEVVRLLLEVGIYRLELDLSQLAEEGRLDPEQLRTLLLPLVERSVPLSGALVFGMPTMDRTAFGQAVDRCLEAGLEDLQLERLLVPPGSPLRDRATDHELAYAAAPPYEVLRHRLASAEEIITLARFAATYSLVSRPLEGTGILRALAQGLGSAFEVIEGFAEGLISRGFDPLTSTPPEPLERLFVEHLRDFCGVDLSFRQAGTRLRRAPLISLRWLDNGRCVVTDDITGRVAHLGSHAMTLLDRFDRGQTAFEVCERIAAQAPADQRGKLRTDLQLTVEKLAALGFLLPGEQTQDGEEVPFTGLEEFEFHCRMLADTVRVEAYRRALNSVVRPGMHVVEIGTGTGILAVLAAKAGARVTAIEQFSLLNVARAVAQESGVEGQIELVRGRSDQVLIGERGDLLVSEIVGNRILNEGLLEMTLDARERLLKPDALLIPERIEVLAELGHTERFALLDQQLTRLCSRYDVDLRPLHWWFHKRREAGRLIWETHQEDDDFSPMTEEVVVIDLDLRQIERADFSTTSELVPVVDGCANSVILAFTLQLQPGITLSTRGRRHELHWSKPIFMLPTPVRLHRGRAVRLRVSYEAHGEIQVAVE